MNSPRWTFIRIRRSGEGGRQGDRETGRQGDRETRRQGDRETGILLSYHDISAEFFGIGEFDTEFSGLDNPFCFQF